MSEITLDDLRKAAKLLDINNEKYLVKVCADCFSLGLIKKNHSDCSGNWFEIDERTGTIKRFGISKQQSIILKRELFHAKIPKNKIKPVTIFGIPVIPSELGEE